MQFRRGCSKVNEKLDEVGQLLDGVGQLMRLARYLEVSHTAKNSPVHKLGTPLYTQVYKSFARLDSPSVHVATKADNARSITSSCIQAVYLTFPSLLTICTSLVLLEYHLETNHAGTCIIHYDISISEHIHVEMKKVKI